MGSSANSDDRDFVECFKKFEDVGKLLELELEVNLEGGCFILGSLLTRVGLALRLRDIDSTITRRYLREI